MGYNWFKNLKFSLWITLTISPPKCYWPKKEGSQPKWPYPKYNWDLPIRHVMTYWICSYCVLDRPVFERCQTLLHPELTPWWSFPLADGAHHKKPHSPTHPLPLGRDMGCLWWVQILLYFIPLSLLRCIQYLIISDLLIKVWVLCIHNSGQISEVKFTNKIFQNNTNPNTSLSIFFRKKLKFKAICWMKHFHRNEINIISHNFHTAQLTAASIDKLKVFGHTLQHKVNTKAVGDLAL